MSFFSKAEKNAEKRLNLSVEEIHQFSPGRLWEYLENKNRKELTFVSEYPAIGRGNVLRDKLISRKELDSDIDAILAKSSV